MDIIKINSEENNVLNNSICGKDYEKISCYDIAKEMWDKIEVTYERTKMVKQTLVNLFFYEHDILKIKDGESIKEK